jgi:hypothetical protein
MIGDYLRSLDGIATLGSIGLLISIAIFVMIVVRVLRTSPERIDVLARLPFDDDSSLSPHHREEVAP